MFETFDSFESQIPFAFVSHFEFAIESETNSDQISDYIITYFMFAIKI